MCEVAGAANALPGPLREVLILHHLEGLDAPALADALAIPAALVTRMLAEGERQFAALLSHLSSHCDEGQLDVHALLVEFAGCLDLPWTSN
jgi:hypothetical protein